MRLAYLVLVLALLCAGCAQLAPVIEPAICVTGDNFMARISASGVTGCVENHNGLICGYGPQEGDLVACEPMPSWDPESWQSMRKTMGLDPRICVTCIDGTVQCPSKRTIKALYGQEGEAGLESLEKHDRRVVEQGRFTGDPHPNGIACPECGAELWDSNPWLVMTSIPPQHEVHCPECGWKGTRY